MWDKVWNLCNKGIRSQVSIDALDQYPRLTLDPYKIDIPLTCDHHQHSMNILVDTWLSIDSFSINSYESVDTGPTIDKLLIKC